MKTTVEIPDQLLREAKRRALDSGITFKELLQRALRRELSDPPRAKAKKVKWVTVEGGLPTDFDVADRGSMYEAMLRDRQRH